MSSGPTLTGENCKSALQTNYLNVSFKREDWCGYKWKCKVNNLLYSPSNACLLCKYRIPLDIPEILRKESIRKNGSNQN